MTLDFPTIALPFALVWALTMGMQFAKPLLEQYVPPFELRDANHDRNIRIAYGLVAFAAILAYALTTLPQPTTLDGWLSFLAGVGVAAQGVLLGGHVTYKTISSSSSAGSAQPPASARTLPEMGLPLTPLALPDDATGGPDEAATADAPATPAA